ncbi:MAG: NAD/NADP octopine/nopaline dehydrogenase family protein, partial [Clostridiales bacterium]|nr:NAD/NADP octopine/nopaline dehydrogenase family protein [Clostridiales bacterium]
IYICTVFGQAGFNWMVEEVSKKFSIDNITTFAFGLIPWICRTKKYGESGIVYGAKPINVAAVTPFDDFNELNDLLFDKVVNQWFQHGAFHQADNFISLTLSLDNQIIHTSRLYGLFLESGGTWDNLDDVPYFYRDFSAKSAEILKSLDDDYSLIRSKIKALYPDKKFTFMLDYLSLDNTTNLISNKTILETFENSKTLGAIKTPVVEKNGKWVIDKNHRFFSDDIYYGLCIAKWIAEQLDIAVPHIDDILTWAQNLLGDRIIENGKLQISDDIKNNPFKYGVPEVYGFTELDQIID